MMGRICSIVALFCAMTSLRTHPLSSAADRTYQWPSSRRTRSAVGAIMALNFELTAATESATKAAGAGTRAEGGSWAGGCTGSLGWLVDFRAQIPWSEPPRMAVKMGGWVCKISNFQDV